MRVRYLVVVVAETGVQRDGPAEGLGRLLVLLRALPDLSEEEVRVGVAGIEARGLFEEAGGQLPLPLDGVDDAEVVVGEIFLRVRRQLDAELFGGVGEARRAVAEQVGEPEVVMDARELGVEGGRLLELLYRLGEEAGLTVGAAEEYA